MTIPRTGSAEMPGAQTDQKPRMRLELEYNAWIVICNLATRSVNTNPVSKPKYMQFCNRQGTLTRGLKEMSESLSLKNVKQHLGH